MTKSELTSNSKASSYGSLAAIRASTSSSQLIDILLTNTFPMHASAFSNAPLPDPSFPPQSCQAHPVADVVRQIKPRYHFIAAGGGEGTTPMFWEREPFVWTEEAGRVSRLVSLGSFGAPPPASGKKQRVSVRHSACITAVTERHLSVVLRIQHRTTHSDL